MMRGTALYIHLTYNFRCNCAILLNHVLACTYYEIIIYVRRNNISHCWYIKVLYVLVVPIMAYHVWRQISTWNNIIMPYWLQRVPQSSISNLVRQGSPLYPPKHHHLLHTDSSMKGLRAHTDNLQVSVLWTPSQAQNHSKTTIASDSPTCSSGPLEFGSNSSEIVSFRLNQTTPQQWLANRMVARCTEIFLHWPKRYWCQPGNTTS